MMVIFEELMFLRLDTAPCYPHCDKTATQGLFRRIFDNTLEIGAKYNACSHVREAFAEM